MPAIGSLPGAILEPGLLWAGQAGYSSCDMDCWHWTAGWNSIGICRDRGLVQHLTRDEGTYQFVADVGMTAYTQCEWNRVATALEVESIDGSVSEAQLALMSYREQWLVRQTGIPPVYYDAVSDGGPRMPIGTPFRGVTTHRSLIHRACDMHSDGFDRWVWERVWGGEPSPQEEGDRMQPCLWADEHGHVFVYDPNGHTKAYVGTPEALGAIQGVWRLVASSGKPAGDPEVRSNAQTHVILRDAATVGFDPHKEG